MVTGARGPSRQRQVRKCREEALDQDLHSGAGEMLITREGREKPADATPIRWPRASSVKGRTASASFLPNTWPDPVLGTRRTEFPRRQSGKTEHRLQNSCVLPVAPKRRLLQRAFVGRWDGDGGVGQ